MIEELIDKVKPLEVQNRDFQTWKAHPITKEFFRDIQRALLEDYQKPLPVDPASAHALRERHDGAKQMLLSLEGWSPKLIDDEDTPNDN